MTEGFSFGTFAALVDCNRDTIYQWTKQHSSFAEAKKIGMTAALYYWECLGIEGLKGNIPGFHSRTWIFMMRNRFGWTSKGLPEDPIDLSPRVERPGAQSESSKQVPTTEKNETVERPNDFPVLDLKDPMEQLSSFSLQDLNFYLDEIISKDFSVENYSQG